MMPSKVGDAAAASSKAPAAADTSEPAGGNKPLTMRGRKRHKCMVCGNIARSRCPFLSCKGCCVKAGNPCQIHVLKAGASGESPQGPATTAPAQGAVISNIVRHNPYDSLRLRTVRPMALFTKKEAFYINSWRFRRLRAYTDGVARSEDNAFDRYMGNTLLLEELFDARGGADDSRAQPPPSGGADPVSDAADISVAGLRLRQRVGAKKRDAHRQKLKRAVDRSLQRLLRKGGEELEDAALENEDLYLSGFAARRELKRMKVQSADGKERLRRMEVFSVLLEKLKAMENQEDFDLCQKMYEDNFLKGLTGRRGGAARAAVDTGQQKPAPAPAPALAEERVVPSAEARDASSFESRLDSCGVLKQWWKVEAAPLGPLVDAPLSSLASL